MCAWCQWQSPWFANGGLESLVDSRHPMYTVEQACRPWLNALSVPCIHSVAEPSCLISFQLYRDPPSVSLRKVVTKVIGVGCRVLDRHEKCGLRDCKGCWVCLKINLLHGRWVSSGKCKSSLKDLVEHA